MCLRQAAPGLLRLNRLRSRSLSPAEQRQDLSVNLVHQACGRRDLLGGDRRQLQGQRLQHGCSLFDAVSFVGQLGNPLHAMIDCRACFVGPDCGQPGGLFLQAGLNALAALAQTRQLPQHRLQPRDTLSFDPLLCGHQPLGSFLKRLGLALGQLALFRRQCARLLGKLTQFSTRCSGGFGSAGQFSFHRLASQQQHRVKQQGLRRQLLLLGADQQPICSG